MVRIIPWSLPPVKGGSTGGYTPKVDPTPPTPEPDPPAKYYDFSGAKFTPKTSGGKTYDLSVTKHGPATWAPDDSVSMTNAIFYGSITGIVELDSVGVASIAAILSTEYINTADSDYPLTSDDLVISIDMLTKAITFVSGHFVPSRAASVGADNENYYNSDVTAATFYVYNGNGEVIQTEEVSYEE